MKNVGVAIEQRDHPRVQIPLIVTVTHPTLGDVATATRDISESGLFIRLDQPTLSVGAKLKVKIEPITAVDTQPIPTVDVEVTRVTEDGIGVMFVNNTARHLWQSVQRLRDVLHVGRDYFQIYVSVMATDRARGILLVQQHGKWLFPGRYLIVGEGIENTVADITKTQIGMTTAGIPLPVATEAPQNPLVAEAATFSVVYSANVDVTVDHVRLSDDFKHHRWIDKLRDLDEITFATEAHRLCMTGALQSTLNKVGGQDDDDTPGRAK